MYKKNLIKTNLFLCIKKNRFKSNDGKFGDHNYKGPIIFDDVINYVTCIDYFRKNTANPHFFVWSDNFMI